MPYLAKASPSSWSRTAYDAIPHPSALATHHHALHLSIPASLHAIARSPTPQIPFIVLDSRKDKPLAARAAEESSHRLEGRVPETKPPCACEVRGRRGGVTMCRVFCVGESLEMGSLMGSHRMERLWENVYLEVRSYVVA